MIVILGELEKWTSPWQYYPDCKPNIWDGPPRQPAAAPTLGGGGDSGYASHPVDDVHYGPDYIISLENGEDAQRGQEVG